MTILAAIDPTVGITIVSSIALTVIVAFMAFLAIAPTVSETWAERLDAVGQTTSFEGDAQHGD